MASFPFDFLLFGLVLLGVALFHRAALWIALAGLAAILVYQGAFGSFPTGRGLDALASHAAHEWVVIANLLLLLTGFELLAHHFERSNVPDHLPDLLPDDWRGGLMLLAIVFLLSAVLDNIASAILGGVMARHLYSGRLTVGFLAAIVASANAGGAGSVIGDTTTTIMWLKGVSPLVLLPAFLSSFAAFAVFAPLAARQQQRFQPILKDDLPGHPLVWRRIGIVVFLLVCAVAANVAANVLSGDGEEHAPWMGLALWAGLLVSSRWCRPDWKLALPALRGAAFLCALVAAASLMPVKALPDPSPLSVFALGGLSSIFDNIPLTVLALARGGYDWALLAYAVGFGGSMAWFGSSAGVALTNDYPEGRSITKWLRQGWFVPVGYVVGFAAHLVLLGWTVP